MRAKLLDSLGVGVFAVSEIVREVCCLCEIEGFMEEIGPDVFRAAVLLPAFTDNSQIRLAGWERDATATDARPDPFGHSAVFCLGGVLEGSGHAASSSTLRLKASNVRSVQKITRPFTATVSSSTVIASPERSSVIVVPASTCITCIDPIGTVWYSDGERVMGASPRL
uniref:Uncharacterized protein n=1 Tax=Chelativorans sp. (strain BNC1) TaxID=266779 RepID=Q11LW4_CHESB